ncbi:MAG: hypothetical protein EB078_04890, partial [Proteobacteria bacterium]|nr:hypothetical protein [Pseudomonadota bacterium]
MGCAKKKVFAVIVNAGTTTLTASFGNIAVTKTVRAYPLQPNPISLIADVKSSTRIDLNWASGGPLLANYQIAYTLGANAPDNCSAGTVIPAATQGSATVLSVTGLNPSSQYSFRVCSANALGDLSTGATVSASTFELDTVPPALALFQLNGGALYSTSTSPFSVNTTLSASDNKYVTEMKISSGALCDGGSWVSYNSSTTVTLNPNSANTFSAIVRDGDGNQSSCLTASITHDNLPPGAPSLIIGNGADYTTTTLVDLALSASENPSQMYITNVPNCASGGTWEAYSTTKTAWILAQTNTTAAVYAKFRDAAGNESTCASDQIIHDNSPPTNPTLAINNGAQTVFLAAVTLTLGAVGASEMYVSNTAGCNTGGTWEAFSSSKNWTLATSDGSTSVYARFRDQAGNLSSCAVASTTVSAPLSDPTEFTATAQSFSQILLSWNDIGLSSGTFTLSYNQGSQAPAACGSGINITQISGSSTSYTIKKLIPKTQYSFRLCVVKPSGETTTGISTFTSTLSDDPNDPSQFTLTAAGTFSANLAWQSGGGTTNTFKVTYREGSIPPASCNVGTALSNIAGNKTSLTVNGLKSGTEYAFRLCAVSVYGTLSSGLTGTVRTAGAVSVAINFSSNTTTITPETGAVSSTTAVASISALAALSQIGTAPVASITLSGTGTFTIDAVLAGGLGNLTLNSGVTLTAPAFAFYKNTATAAANAGTVPTWPVFSTDPVGAGFSLDPANGNGRLVLNLSGNLVVNSGATITMDGKGYPGGGYGPGQAVVNAWGTHRGATTSGYSHEGFGLGGAGRFNGGGASYGTIGGGQAGSTLYGASNFWQKLYLGSGGAAANNTWREDKLGGYGGGAISIKAANITNSGTITAKGTKPYATGGGGSGGTIFLNADYVLNQSGLVTVQGGISGTTTNFGGNGRYKLSGSSVNQNGTVVGVPPEGDMYISSVIASLDGTSTINQQTYGSLVSSSFSKINSVTDLISAVGGSRPTVIFSGSGTFTFDAAWSSYFGDLTVLSGQTVIINVAPGSFNKITVNSGGVLTVNTAISAKNITINGTGNLNAAVNNLE